MAIHDAATPRAAVALFIRQPLAGRVKTRLASDLGVQAACDLYCAMVSDILAQVRACRLPLFLFHDGEESVCLPAEWTAAAALVVRQSGNSLGERMTAAFEHLFSLGLERVVLTGSDIPGIHAQLLLEAVTALDTHEVVIAPALDGGYCLIASRKSHFSPVMFQDIPWSTAQVLEKTLCACRLQGQTVKLLETLGDIDTSDDLRTYCKKPAAHASATNRWLSSRGYVLERT
jgi:rSAM/selenodomain-associated transferase 1